MALSQWPRAHGTASACIQLSNPSCRVASAVLLHSYRLAFQLQAAHPGSEGWGVRVVSLARISPGSAEIRAAEDFSCPSLSRGKTQEKPQTRCIAKASHRIKLLWKERKTL